MLGMWLRMLNQRKMVALNDRLINGSKCQTEDMMALNSRNERKL